MDQGYLVLLIKIFSRSFYRLSSGNTHNVKGHGLGLYFAKQMLNEMGSDLNLVSEKEGAHFIIKLRLND